MKTLPLPAGRFFYPPVPLTSKNGYDGLMRREKKIIVFILGLVGFFFVLALIGIPLILALLGSDLKIKTCLWNILPCRFESARFDPGTPSPAVPLPAHPVATEAEATRLARFHLSLPEDAPLSARIVSRDKAHCLSQEARGYETAFWEVVYNDQKGTLSTVYIGRENGLTAGVCVTDISNPLFPLTIRVREQDGSHIFDGAVIAAIRKETWIIIDEQIADANGITIFTIPPGSYRFQPSPKRETRVTGSLDMDVREAAEATLFLSEMAPTFGAPVDTCGEKLNAIRSSFENANYCEQTTDCAFIQPPAFCWAYIYKDYQTITLFQRIREYTASCNIPEEARCITVAPPVCRLGRCTLL